MTESFVPDDLYLFDIRNCVNEFTAHKQFLYSYRKDNIELRLQQVNALSGLISINKQFFDQYPQEVTFTDGLTLILVQLKEEGVWLACEKKRLSREWLTMIGQVIQSQIGSFQESVTTLGLRYTRYVVDVFMEILISLLGKNEQLQLIQPYNLLLGVRHSQNPHYYSLLTVLLSKSKGAECAMVFDRSGQYISSANADPDMRGLVQLLVRINLCSDVNQQIDVRKFIDNPDTQVPETVAYLEPQFPDEYSKRKGVINDPLLNSATLKHPLLPTLQGQLVRVHKLFSGSLLEISQEEAPFDLPNALQVENVVLFYLNRAWYQLHIHSYNDSVYALVYGAQCTVDSSQIDQIILQTVQFAGEDLFMHTAQERTYFDKDRKVLSINAANGDLRDRLFDIINRYDGVKRGSLDGTQFMADLGLVEVFPQATEGQFQQ